MKIAKRDIFIGIGGILVGALVYKYFYSNKPMANPAPAETEEDGSADESGSEDNASFLGLGKKSRRAETAKKVGEAYTESLKSGLNPIYATKKVAGKIRGSRMSPKEKQNALAQLRDVSTASDNLDGSIGI
jgi:hypothetical protein